MLQQGVAEELERERQRNLKQLNALKQTNRTILRQREESQRVVMHLHSLIDGQTHHMEHIVRQLNKAPELSGDGEENFDNAEDDKDEPVDEVVHQDRLAVPAEPHRLSSRASTVDGLDAEKVNPEMEKSFFSSLVGDGSKRANRLSIADVADRHLRDKTDAIADIIRNISEQCAAAVEGLQLAHDADDEGDVLDTYKPEGKPFEAAENNHEHLAPTEGSEMGEAASENDTSYLNPSCRNSSIPPTPELVHNRSSTSMSNVSQSTGADRISQQYSMPGDVSTKIMGEDAELERVSDAGQSETGVMSKHTGAEILRPATARIAPSTQ